HAPQLVHFRWRQHGRRLVENQNAGAAVQRLEDLDALRLADGELRDALLDGYSQSAPLGQRADLALRARAVEMNAARDLGAEHHVLRDGERWHEHEMLMYHPDAGRDRFRGGPAGDVAVVDFDRAGIRAKHAAQ